jgi:hypothetical protein
MRKVLGDDIMGKDPENSDFKEGDCTCTVARQQADHQSFPRIIDSIVCALLCSELRSTLIPPRNDLEANWRTLYSLCTL